MRISMIMGETARLAAPMMTSPRVSCTPVELPTISAAPPDARKNAISIGMRRLGFAIGGTTRVVPIPTTMGKTAQSPAAAAVMPPSRRISGNQSLRPCRKKKPPRLTTRVIFMTGIDG